MNISKHWQFYWGWGWQGIKMKINMDNDNSPLVSPYCLGSTITSS